MNTTAFPLVAVLLLATPQASASAPAPSNTLTVALFNDARVPPAVLAGAQDTASYLFAKSGIEIRWMLCGREDGSVSLATQLRPIALFDDFNFKNGSYPR